MLSVTHDMEKVHPIFVPNNEESIRKGEELGLEMMPIFWECKGCSTAHFTKILQTYLVTLVYCIRNDNDNFPLCNFFLV